MTGPEAPPEPSHRGATVAGVVLLALWATFTFGARPLTPLIRDVLDRVEVAGGFDVTTVDEADSETEAE